MQAITKQAPAPQPASPRRRTEDTGKTFQAAAKKIVQRTARIPTAAYRAVAYLWDTLAWLDQWNQHGNNDADDTEVGPSTHLYPHL